MSCPVEIISIGNELLIGKILNTNAQWLSRLITNLGGNVRRTTTVGDDLEEIASALNEAIARKPRFIITTGGLGPTFDDMTVEAVSRALDRPLRLNEQALEMVRERYRRYEARTGRRVDLSPARLKMARLPEGGGPLHNPVGTAPGVLIEVGGVSVVILPGVPEEMEAIFEGSVVPMIRGVAGPLSVYERSLRVTGMGEPEIAPLIERTMRDNPYVYVKSHPRRARPTPWIELHLMTTSDSEADAKVIVERAVEEVTRLIHLEGAEGGGCP
ncbi:MAG: molybdopterin-binding protein, partial [Candidatus Bathyarchaeia archaeon]